MLKDITIGQYFPGNSFIHKLDPRMKLILTIGYIVMLFITNNLYGFLFSGILLVFCYKTAKIPIKMILKSLKPILPILIFTAVLNVFFIANGNLLFKFWIFKVYDMGLYTAFSMAVRIVLLIASSSLLTYTTSPITLTDAIESLLKPLKVIKFPVHELAMMMSIALRFIPTLIEETEKIISAQKARGADLESGSIVSRAKALVPILIPLFISSFRRAEELALAMECRCYRGGEGRTRMRELHYSFKDFVALFVIIMGITLTVILNRFL